MGDEKIMINRAFPDVETPWKYRSVVMNTTLGEEVDSFSFSVGKRSFHEDKIIAITSFFGMGQIGLLNIEEDDFVALHDLEPERGGIENIIWINEEEVAWVDNWGLNKMHIGNGAISLLKANCENSKVAGLHGTPNNEHKVIINEVHFTPLNDTEIDIKSRLFQYDLNTGEQWLLGLN